MGGRISKFFNESKYTENENLLWDKYCSQFTGGISMTCRNCGDPNVSRCECTKRKYIRQTKTNLKKLKT